MSRDDTSIRPGWQAGALEVSRVIGRVFFAIIMAGVAVAFIFQIASLVSGRGSFRELLFLAGFSVVTWLLFWISDRWHKFLADGARRERADYERLRRDENP